jgi:hypothetical protein
MTTHWCKACGVAIYRSMGGWWHNASLAEVIRASRNAGVPDTHKIEPNDSTNS